MIYNQKNYRQLLRSLKHKCIVQSPPHRVAQRRTHVRVLERRSSFFETWSPSRRLVQVHARARPTFQNRIFHRVSHTSSAPNRHPHTTFRTASTRMPMYANNTRIRHVRHAHRGVQVSVLLTSGKSSEKCTPLCVCTQAPGERPSHKASQKNVGM
jgi:hypothetical protein